MPQGRREARKQLAAIEAKRRRNLRQLLLKASRIVNRHVVEELQARGHSGLRSTHTTLLSNIDLAGSSVTEAAELAGITKQAMGRLAAELEEAGFVRVKSDAQDGRVKVLQLTDEGHRLMMDSLDAMADLERRYARAMGKARLIDLQRGLRSFIEEFDRLVRT
jgi:DNA-binding MarR family transcriptional regulator